MRFNLLSVSVVLALVLFCGCASRRPQPLQAPLATIDRSTFSGSALSGPTTKPVNAQASDQALIASVDLVALDNVPAILNPIASDVRLIASTRGEDVIQSNGELTQPLRWSVGDTSVPQIKGRSAAMSHDDFALPAGACKTVSVIDPQRIDHRFDILLQQSATNAGGLVVAIAISDHMSAGDKRTREMAVLKPVKISQATPIALLIPFQFSKTETRSVLMTMNVRPATSKAEDAKLLADASAAIDKSRSMVASAAKSSPGAQPWSGYDIAMRALDDPASRRAGLAFLCRRVHAPICEDFALVGDDAALDAVVSKIKNATNKSTIATSDALGWMFDSSALGVAADLQSQDKLPPELLALLIRHTGQVGMNSGSVAELLGATKSRKEFDARVLAENLIYLEDSSPAARVRASDWLAAQGKSVAGYDPLAPPRQRQDALQKMYDTMSTQAVARDGGRP